MIAPSTDIGVSIFEVLKSQLIGNKIWGIWIERNWIILGCCLPLCCETALYQWAERRNCHHWVKRLLSLFLQLPFTIWCRKVYSPSSDKCSSMSVVAHDIGYSGSICVASGGRQAFWIASPCTLKFVLDDKCLKYSSFKIFVCEINASINKELPGCNTATELKIRHVFISSLPFVQKIWRVLHGNRLWLIRQFISRNGLMNQIL